MYFERSLVKSVEGLSVCVMAQQGPCRLLCFVVVVVVVGVVVGVMGVVVVILVLAIPRFNQIKPQHTKNNHNTQRIKNKE